MIYEILDGKTVINTISAGAEFMEAAFPDGNYREVPEPEAPKEKPIRILPAGAFRLRFTFLERAGVELSSVIDPSAPEDVRQTQATVKTFYADLNSQRTINLDSPSVMLGCLLLDRLGILEEGWEKRIIEADVTQEELGFGS